MYLAQDDKNGPVDTGDIEIPKDDISYSEDEPMIPSQVPDEDDRESDNEPKEPDTTDI